MKHVYVVGGAVRDILIGLEPNDIDYCVVGSNPEEMIECGYRQIEATSFPVFHDSIGNEYALARTEHKTGNGYHGFECIYDDSVSIEEDLFRRDLSINAMAVKVEFWDDFKTSQDVSLLIDPYHGFRDIQDHRIHPVSLHFCDDPVRVLRSLRLSVRYNFDISSRTETYIELMMERGELEHLIPERIWLEISKVLNENKNISRFFEYLTKFGIDKVIFPTKADIRISRSGLAVFESLHITDEIYAFIMMMEHNNLNNVKIFCQELKIPNIFYNFLKLFRIIESCIIEHELDSIRTFNCLKNGNAYHNFDNFKFILELFRMLGYTSNCDLITELYKETKFISFGNLSFINQSTLIGSDIQTAIDDIKLIKISKYLEKSFG